MNKLKQDNEQYKNSNALAVRRAFYAGAIGEDLFDHLMQNLVGFDGMFVLDIGCGYGTDLIEILSRFKNVDAVGVDPSENQIEQALVAAEQAGQTIDFQVGGLEDIQGENRFDRITMRHVLHLIENKSEAVSHMMQLLKPEGRALIVLHSDATLPNLEKFIAWYCNEYQATYSRNQRSITLERTGGIFDHLDTEFIKTEQMIQLHDAEPMVNYVETLRHRFSPAPSDASWEAFLNYVKNEFEAKIASKGVFEEQSRNGIVVIRG